MKILVAIVSSILIISCGAKPSAKVYNNPSYDTVRIMKSIEVAKDNSVLVLLNGKTSSIETINKLNNNGKIKSINVIRDENEIAKKHSSYDKNKHKVLLEVFTKN
ncbi:MAG: hypothetical protein Q4C75_02325 [Bergeyella zoohelcum]|nr:hypothetical protein [Bergeyella zoohelcum]